MLEKFILPGQRVELKVVERIRLNKSEKDLDTKVYTSKVYDVISEDRLELFMPMEQTKLILLPVDAEYELYFYTENGLYECVAKIIDRYKSNNVYLLAVELETNLRKYQRREFYRYSCALNLDTRNLADQEIQAVEKKKNYLVPGLPLKQSVIVDISGGGLRFVANYAYEKNSLIYCKYQLMIHGGEKTYEIICKILDVKPIPNKKDEYEHRVTYMNLNNQEREEIIQFIFEEERRSRKREKGL